MKFKGEKFLTPNELKSKAQDWKKQAKKKESPESDPSSYYHNGVDRIEEHPREGKNIKEEHGVSFLEKIIPSLIRTKKDGKRVKILDLGGGVGDFANQIRQKFGAKVEVFTTGLSKKAAREFKKKRFKELHRNPDFRQVLKTPLSLHPNDLKWRSVLELSDYPEFDLIIDTIGEQYYQKFTKETPLVTYLNYIRAVAKKLNSGGQAYITPSLTLWNISMAHPELLENLESELNVVINNNQTRCQITKLN